MARFRFIIADTFDGTVKGTDDEVTALTFAECEEFFVTDTQTGEWLGPQGERHEIQNAVKPD